MTSTAQSQSTGLKQPLTPPTVTVSTCKPDIQPASTAYLDHQAYVQGTFPVKLGANVVVHPRARLLSFQGPLTIGAGTVIAERCVVGGPAPEDPKGPVPPPPEEPVETTVGQNVMLHAAAQIECGSSLEDGCLVEPRAVVMRGVKMGKHSKACAATIVDRSVPDWIVILGGGQVRRLRQGAEGPEEGRLNGLQKEREAMVNLLKTAAAKATLGKRRG